MPSDGEDEVLGMPRQRRVAGRKLHLVIEPDETGVYVAHVIELPGCISQGSTYREALDNIFAALEGYLAVQIRRQGEQVLASAAHGKRAEKKEIELALV